MYYVYVLKSETHKLLYVGYTGNLKRRLQEHLRGNTVTTKRLQMKNLIFYEAFKSKADAHRREKYLKSTKGHSSLKQIIRESIK